MDADAGDLALFLQRHDDQVERHAAVHGRAQVRLGDQRHRPALLEIADRALAAALVGGIVGQLHDAEPVGRPLAVPLDLVAEQGHGAASQPVKQVPPFEIVDLVGLLVHLRLHRAPVGDGGADVGEDAVKLGTNSARPFASARSTSIYMIDSRRSRSSQRASTAVRQP